MYNTNLFRIGGIAAIASAILYVLSLGVAFTGSTGSLGTTLYIVSSLLFLGVLIVLYVELRIEAALPVLIALTLLGALTIWSLFLNPTEISPIFGPFALAYGIGFVLLGWLQHRSSRYPNGTGVLAIVTGVIAVIAGVALIAGASIDVFGLLNLALSVPFVIWLVWLSWIFLKGEAAAARQV